MIVVVQTQWKIDDLAAALFGSFLVEELSNGAGFRSAFQNAKRRLREVRTDFVLGFCDEALALVKKTDDLFGRVAVLCAMSQLHGLLGNGERAAAKLLEAKSVADDLEEGLVLPKTASVSDVPMLCPFDSPRFYASFSIIGKVE